MISPYALALSVVGMGVLFLNAFNCLAQCVSVVGNEKVGTAGNVAQLNSILDDGAVKFDLIGSECASHRAIAV